MRTADLLAFPGQVVPGVELYGSVVCLTVLFLVVAFVVAVIQERRG